jgi:hypothetical protein
VLIEAAYVCESCGEAIVIEVDPSAGDEQEYVEDCPVCCRPHVLAVSFEGGRPSVQGRAE